MMFLLSLHQNSTINFSPHTMTFLTSHIWFLNITYAICSDNGSIAIGYFILSVLLNVTYIGLPS